MEFRHDNRLMYDRCAQKHALYQSVSPLSFQLDPVKYHHCNKCRPELGIVGGTAVSHVDGNLVDLENDLTGRNRPVTHCPSYKYIPDHDSPYLQGKEYIKPVCHPKISKRARHLRPCQFTTIAPVPAEPALDVHRCPAEPRRYYV